MHQLQWQEVPVSSAHQPDAATQTTLPRVEALDHRLDVPEPTSSTARRTSFLLPAVAWLGPEPLLS